jgi:hypothetical protein
VREDERLGGGKGWKETVYNRNVRSSWERQGIVAFCTCQWNERISLLYNNVGSHHYRIGAVTCLFDSSILVCDAALVHYWFLTPGRIVVPLSDMVEQSNKNLFLWTVWSWKWTTVFWNVVYTPSNIMSCRILCNSTVNFGSQKLFIS